MIKVLKKKKFIGEKSKPQAKHIVAAIVMTCIGLFMASYILSLIYMLFWTFNNSLKGDRLFTNFPFALANIKDLRLIENYSIAFNRLSQTIFNKAVNRNITFTYWNMFVNSLLFSVGTSAMGIFMNFLVAYPMGRYNFPGKKFLFNLAIAIMVIPVVGNVSSSLYVRKQLDIYDNMFLHIVCSQGGFGMNFMLIYGAVKGISGSYIDAAKIDGAGHFTILFKICLPMVFPLMFCLFALAFTGTWNDYSTILVYLPSSPNLAYGLHLFRSTATAGQGITEPQILAAYVLVAIPSAIFWCFGQRFVMDNYTIGGLKE